MAATILVDDLENYATQYGTHGAIQRLQFVASKTENKTLKIEATRLCLESLKRTSDVKGYAEVYGQLKDLLEGSETTPPPYDSVWVEATQKHTTVLKELHEQELHQAKVQQMKDETRSAHVQLTNLCLEQGDYSNALKYASKSREYCSEPQAVFSTCMAIIRLSALLRQYTDIQSFTSKAQHTPYKEEAAQSKIHTAFGLYYMTSGKYKDAAASFAQVKYQELGQAFQDVVCAQDVCLYSVLCALASLDRTKVQKQFLESPFRECLDLVPRMRDIAMDFCACKYAACLSALDSLQEPLSLDVHLHGQVQDICQQIRSKCLVQYFQPFISVSLHSMATAFNTDVEGIQREVAKLIGKGHLDAKIDSHNKILHARQNNERKTAYVNAMRVSQDFLDSTQALLLRMNLLKHDFGVNHARQKK